MHTKPNNWWNKLFARQQFEFVVDAPPSEAVQRLSKLAPKGNSGYRRLKVVTTDEAEVYQFQLRIMEHSRGFDFTRASCKGIISKADAAEQAHIRYDTKRTILIWLHDSVLIVFLLTVFLVAEDTIARLALVCLVYLFVVAFVVDFNRDRELGQRVYEALTSPVSPASKLS